MFYFDKQRALQKNLPIRHRSPEGYQWRLRQKDMISTADRVSSILKEEADIYQKKDVQVLKDIERRILFRLSLNEPPKSVILKVFRFYRFKKKVKHLWKKYTYSNYGFGETCNLILAAERGIYVPKVYGFGKLPDRFGWTSREAVILEDLSGHLSLNYLLQSTTIDNRQTEQIFENTIPILASLYRAGCNHIDLNLGSLLFNPKNLAEKPYLLDFEYAQFHKKPSQEVLMFEAASLAKSLGKWLGKEDLKPWLDKLLDSVEIQQNLRKDLVKRFDYYFNTNQLSPKKRMRIS